MVFTRKYILPCSGLFRIILKNRLFSGTGSVLLKPGVFKNKGASFLVRLEDQRCLTGITQAQNAVYFDNSVAQAKPVTLEGTG